LKFSNKPDDYLASDPVINYQIKNEYKKEKRGFL